MSFVDLSGGGPDFGRIHIGDFTAIEDAFRILWFGILAVNSQGGQVVNLLQQRLRGQVYTLNPGGNPADWDIGNALVVNCTSVAGFSWSGIRNGSNGRIIFVVNTGAGTVTINHNNVSSAVGNRFFTSTSADKTIPQFKSMTFCYLTSVNFWQEVSPV